MNTLIQKQIALLTTIQQLSEAASACDSSDILLYTKDSNGQLVPLASEPVQDLILTESLVAEIRGGALDAVDQAVTQLEALGITLSPEAVSEINTTSEEPKATN